MIDQNWNPATYAAAAYVPDMGRDVLALLNPQPGERVLDLGCGDGVLTLALLEAGCEVVAIDGSAAMVAAARERGIDARVVDAQQLTFAREFDAVFSNAALHWMTNPADVLAGVSRALRPGGRFVAEFGGAGNVANMRAALDAALALRDVAVACPWFFPEPALYRSMLAEAGFGVVSLAHFARPIALSGDARAWLQTFAQHYLNTVPEADRDSVLDDAMAALRRSNINAEGCWFIDYVRLRFHAVMP